MTRLGNVPRSVRRACLGQVACFGFLLAASTANSDDFPPGYGAKVNGVATAGHAELNGQVLLENSIKFMAGGIHSQINYKVVRETVSKTIDIWFQVQFDSTWTRADIILNLSNFKGFATDLLYRTDYGGTDSKLDASRSGAPGDTLTFHFPNFYATTPTEQKTMWVVIRTNATKYNDHGHMRIHIPQAGLNSTLGGFQPIP
jgi:hypothetical protein